MNWPSFVLATSFRKGFKGSQADLPNDIFTVAITLPGLEIQIKQLRTVPTFVTAHLFYASRDTIVSNGWNLLIWKYSCAVSNYADKAELSKWSWYLKKKIGGNHAFFRDNKASIWRKKRHTLLCILLLFRIIVV